MNIIKQLEFELIYYDLAVQGFNPLQHEDPPPHMYEYRYQQVEIHTHLILFSTMTQRKKEKS